MSKAVMIATIKEVWGKYWYQVIPEVFDENAMHSNVRHGIISEDNFVRDK